ncbi:MAG: TonB-dependent receptor family protein [Bacteroidales bacterium]|nr:TonB-dependent receptor family protein [Bacteroidales bacterium]
MPQNYNSFSHDNWHSLYHGGGTYLYYQHKFNNEGHYLSANAYGGWWGNQSKSTSFDHYEAQPQLSYDNRTQSPYTSGYGSLGINYSYPYSKKGEIGTGIDLDFSNSRSDYLRDTMDAANVYHTDALRSDSSRSGSTSASAYLSWRREWGNFTFSASARGSLNKSTSRHVAEPQFDTTIHYFSFSPSVYLSYSTESMHSFSLSYSTRTSHPSAGSLSRYVRYGIASYSTGNPDLAPSRSHEVELEWSKYFEKGHSVGIDASVETNTDEESSIDDPVYSPLFGRWVNFSKPYNAEDNRRFNISANAMYRPTAFLNFRLYTGITNNWYHVMVRPDKWIENQMTSWNISARIWAKLWNRLNVFVSGQYRSRRLGYSGTDIDEPYKSINLGMSADFFDRRLSLYFNANDIFNWEQWSRLDINPYSNSSYLSKSTSSYLTFGLTLRFGKMELSNSSREGIQEGSSSGRK